MAKPSEQPYNPGDSATDVQTPAGTLYLNHLLGSSGSQKFNAPAVSPTGMYSGGQQQGGQQQGGQQTRERRTDFSKAQNPNRGRPSRGNRSGAVQPMNNTLGGISTQSPGGQQAYGPNDRGPLMRPDPRQQGGGQQAVNRSLQAGNMRANAGPQWGQQGGGQQQYGSADLSRSGRGGIQNPAGQQMDEYGNLLPNQDFDFSSEGERFQPVDDGIFAQNADAMGTIIRGEGVVGETDAQVAQRERALNDSLGDGARERFDTTMSVNQPGMLSAMAGAQGGMGQGGYGADGRPVSAFDADVGTAYSQQSGLEATGQQRLGARESQGLQQAQNSQNQYTQDLMNNIDSAASSTLSNQLGSVGSQMEAAGLGRSGANGLASSRMGQQILGGAMRDKMNVLSQQTDRMSGQTFQGQQNRMGRMAASENEALKRMQNTGMGVTDAQTARLMNEEAVKSGARGENREQFALGDNVERNARGDMLASEAGFRGTEQERQDSILAGQQKGVSDLGMLATGINQQPIDWRRNEPQRQNPGVQLGGNILQGAANGYFGGGPDTFER